MVCALAHAISGETVLRGLKTHLALSSSSSHLPFGLEECEPSKHTFLAARYINIVMAEGGLYDCDRGLARAACPRR